MTEWLEGVARKRRGMQRPLILYSPGGCGCALVMLPFMLATTTITIAMAGYACCAVILLTAAVVSSVRYRHIVAKQAGNTKISKALLPIIILLYVVSLPYLIFFVWLFFC